MNLEVLVKDLEGRTQQQLRDLYADALKDEAQAKQDLYMLRKRIANLATDTDEHEEDLLVEAKKVIADKNVYLQAIESVLGSAAKSSPTTAPIVTSNQLPELKPEILASPILVTASDLTRVSSTEPLKTVELADDSGKDAK